MKVMVVRSGSAILFSEFGQRPVSIGDVVTLGSNVLCGSEPEGHITVTTVYLDTDYVIDQVFWQYAGFLRDRLDAQDFAERVYAEPAQILHLGEDRAGRLMPWLDELVALSIDGDSTQGFYRMQALWFSVAHVIAPFITVSPGRVSASQRAHTRPTLPRYRRFAPLRADGTRSNQRSVRRVPILPPDRIRTLPFGTGVTLLRSAPPIVTDLRAWPSRPNADQLREDRAGIETLLRRPADS